MIELYRGDCLELMKHVPEASLDMILTDPPYCSGGLFAGSRKASTARKYCSMEHNGASKLHNFSGDNMDQRSFTEFMRMVFVKCREKAKPESIAAVFVDWRNLPAMTDALQTAGWIYRGIVVWDKGTSRAMPNRFRNDCEYIVWGSKRYHQTEKPVELLEKLLAICPAGGKVLDPFMGSGTTAVACINTGKAFIGMEVEEYYFQVAKERIKEAERAIEAKD